MSVFSRIATLFLFGTAAAACEAKWVSMGYDVPVQNLGPLPNGPVWSCYGNGCPYGECDNEEFVTDVDCDDAYPGPVDGDALFCQPSAEGSYCLLIGDDSLSVEYWVVTCGGGTATAERCGSGCSDASFETASCI